MAPLTQNEAYIRSLVAELNSAVDGPVSLDGTNKAAALQVARKLTEALDAPGDAMIQDILMVFLPGHFSRFVVMLLDMEIMLTESLAARVLA